MFTVCIVFLFDVTILKTYKVEIFCNFFVFVISSYFLLVSGVDSHPSTVPLSAVPFNNRLSSSTPIVTPCRVATTAITNVRAASPDQQRCIVAQPVHHIHPGQKHVVQTNAAVPGLSSDDQSVVSSTLGAIQEHALNSLQYIEAIEPPHPPDPGPHLIKGAVQFAPNPSTETDRLRAVLQQQARANLQYSLYSNTAERSRTSRVPTTVPQSVQLFTTMPECATGQIKKVDQLQQTDHMPPQKDASVSCRIAEDIPPAANNDHLPSDAQLPVGMAQHASSLQIGSLLPNLSASDQQVLLKQQLLLLQNQRQLHMEWPPDPVPITLPQNLSQYANYGSSHYQPISPFRADLKIEPQKPVTQVKVANEQIHKGGEPVQWNSQETVISDAQSTNSNNSNKVDLISLDEPKNVAGLQSQNTDTARSGVKVSKKTKDKTKKAVQPECKTASVKTAGLTQSSKHTTSPTSGDPLESSPEREDDPLCARPSIDTSKFRKHLQTVKQQLR